MARIHLYRSNRIHPLQCSQYPHLDNLVVTPMALEIQYYIHLRSHLTYIPDRVRRCIPAPRQPHTKSCLHKLAKGSLTPPQIPTPRHILPSLWRQVAWCCNNKRRHFLLYPRHHHHHLYLRVFPDLESILARSMVWRDPYLLTYC